MLIDAPAARITMHGRAGFRARDYDMTIDVIPHLGGTLPVVGAVIGGPVGAAAGLVVQGLVGKGINRAAGSVYRVTGSWDKPKIVTVEGAEPAPPTSAGSAASVPSPAFTPPAPPASLSLPGAAASAAGASTSGAIPAPSPAAGASTSVAVPAASSSSDPR
jgi:predicted lipid-binding transport protein (Tim44 family)